MSTDAAAQATDASRLFRLFRGELNDQYAKFSLEYQQGVIEQFLALSDQQQELAEQRLRAHFKWRSENIPGGGGVGFDGDDRVGMELQKPKWHAHGADRDGSPVLVIHSARFDPTERELSSSVRSLLCVIEQILHIDAESKSGGSGLSDVNTSGKILVVYDRTGFCWRHADMELYRALGDIAVQYPGKIKQVLVHPVDEKLLTLWKIVQWYFPEQLRSKVNMVSNKGDVEQHLQDAFPWLSPDDVHMPTAVFDDAAHPVHFTSVPVSGSSMGSSAAPAGGKEPIGAAAKDSVAQVDGEAQRLPTRAVDDPDPRASIINASWQIIAASDQQTTVACLFRNLFAIAPQLSHTFKPKDTVEQGKRILHACSLATALVLGDEDARESLLSLGAQFADRGLQHEDLSSIGQAVLQTFEIVLAEQWSSSVSEAWTTVLEQVLMCMTQGGRQRHTLIRSSWRPLWAQKQATGQFLSDCLMRNDASFRKVFHDGDTSDYEERTVAAVNEAVQSLDSSDSSALGELGAFYQDLGLDEKHCDSVGQALVAALSSVLGDDFTDAHRLSWSGLIDRWTALMLDGMKNSASEKKSANSSDDVAKSSQDQGDPMADMVHLVRSSWAQMALDKPRAASFFYDRMHALDPTASALFHNTDMKQQGARLMDMLGEAVARLDQVELIPVLRQLGASHVAYGVQEHHYEVAGAALLDTLAEAIGEAFTSEVKDAWTSTYEIIKTTMLEGAAKRNASASTVTPTGTPTATPTGDTPDSPDHKLPAQTASDPNFLRSPSTPSDSLQKSISTVERTWAAVAEDKSFAVYFYKALGSQSPKIAQMLRDVDLDEKRTNFVGMLSKAIQTLRESAEWKVLLEDLGRQHANFGVKAKYYVYVRDALLEAVQQSLGKRYTKETRAAWIEVFNTILHSMKKGTRRASTTGSANGSANGSASGSPVTKGPSARASARASARTSARPNADPRSSRRSSNRS